MQKEGTVKLGKFFQFKDRKDIWGWWRVQ